MGNCGSSDIQRAESRISAQITEEMAAARKMENSKIKLLLLGAGESGKSTIFKQMRVLYGAPLSTDEMRETSEVIHSNLIISMQALIQASIEMGNDSKFLEENKADIELISKNTARSMTVNIRVGTALKSLWTDPGITSTWKRRAEYQIVESVQAFFKVRIV